MKVSGLSGQETLGTSGVRGREASRHHYDRFLASNQFLHVISPTIES